MQNKFRVLDLFSGIGGFSLGLESTGGFETIGFVEKDSFCQKVLKKNFNNINIEGDIRNVRGEKYAAEVITGGFPCQPFSVAGKRKSTEDDRYLWDEMLRVIREVKPRWVIGENVEGIININEGVVLRQVQTDLENEGFKVQCIIIPASGIGAWHQRKRVWIIANNISNSNNNGSYRSQINETKQSCNEQKDRLSFRDDTHVPNSNTRLSIRENEEIQTRGNTFDNGSQDVSNSDSFRYGGWSSEGCTNEGWSFFQREQEGGKMGSEVEGCNRNVSNAYKQRTQIQIKREQSGIKMFGSTSKENWWQTQSRICGVPNGVSYELDKDRTNRIKSLGNSIVPQIARELGLAILKAEYGTK